jgi:2'-5' RNA ligase
MKGLSFALVCSDRDNELFTKYSQDLLSGLSPVSILSDVSIPHLTIAQFEGSEDELASIWNAWKSCSTETQISVKLAGLCILPSPDDSECWIEVPALKSDDLQNVQKKILSLDMIKGRRVFNGTGDNYRPHLTLGLLRPFASRFETTHLPGSLLRAEISMKIALGISGENYALTAVAHQ